MATFKGSHFYFIGGFEIVRQNYTICYFQPRMFSGVAV